MKNFRKGDTATHFCVWDCKGTVTWQHVTVRSCGQRQMALFDRETGENLGNHFDPETGANKRYSFRSITVVGQLTDDEAREQALKLAAQWLEEERERIARIAQRRPDCPFQQQMATESLAELHEPRAMSWDEASQR